jgi:hypothetical protein
MIDKGNGNNGAVRLTLAQALGEEPERIIATNPRWVQLMREGVLVRLHIGRWRARTTLDWRDLGIAPGRGEEEQVLDELLQLGHKFLLPRDELRALDNADSTARKWLEKNAFRTHWGFFVPVTAYAEWKAKNEEFRREYLAIRDRMTANFGGTVERQVARYRVAARDAYRRLRRLDPDAVTEIGEGEFVARFVERIACAIPLRERFSGSFYYEVELEYIPLPSLLAEEEAEASRIRAQARAEQERLELAQQLERERAWAEEARIRAGVEAARSAAAWKEQLMREMHREVVAQARRRKEQVVDSFLRDVVAQLRTLVYEAATNVLASIQKNGHLHSWSVVQLRNLVEQVAQLNFVGDADLEAMVAGVQVQLDLAAGDRSVHEVERALRDVAVVTRATLIGLGEQPRSARSLGVPDEPPPELVRTARGRLSLGESLQALPLPGMGTPRRVRAALQAVAVAA